MRGGSVPCHTYGWYDAAFLSNNLTFLHEGLVSSFCSDMPHCEDAHLELFCFYFELQNSYRCIGERNAGFVFPGQTLNIIFDLSSRCLGKKVAPAIVLYQWLTRS